MACTLKDVAKRANVSIVTVHKCIYGKPGISEETRKRVLAIVEEMHYTVNPSASSLKRDNVNIAVVCPNMTSQLNSFYVKLAQGAEQAAQELASYGVNVRIIPSGSTGASQNQVMDRLLEEENLHGVAAYCLDDGLLDETFDKFSQRNIPVVTFNADAPGSHRLACVAAPTQRMGELAAELLLKLNRDHKRIIIVGGDKRLSNLRDNTTGFYSYIQQNDPEISLLEINNSSRTNLQEELEKVLASLDDVTGIYCSMTRNAIPVCQSLHRMGLQRKIRLICTDVFQELYPYVQDGTVDATIWQNPQMQCYNATMLLYYYLTTGKLQDKYFKIPISPVMLSNFEYFL